MTSGGHVCSPDTWPGSGKGAGGPQTEPALYQTSKAETGLPVLIMPFELK